MSGRPTQRHPVNWEEAFGHYLDPDFKYDATLMQMYACTVNTLKLNALFLRMGLFNRHNAKYHHEIAAFQRFLQYVFNNQRDEPRNRNYDHMI